MMKIIIMLNLMEKNYLQNIALDEIGLIKGQLFSLHYDFGDDWLFRIKVSKISEVSKEEAPYLIKARGGVLQYPYSEKFL